MGTICSRITQRLMIGIAVLCLATVVHAQGAGSAQGPLSKLSIHGFMTQAYAEGSFGKGGLFTPSTDELFLGIPEDGTTNYRTMALQFRYEVTEKDVMVVQLSHRKLAFSPVDRLTDEVELDWAFYERRIGNNTAIKVGRVQIPFGIFNEVRDVGTILPFFRPSFVFYQEGSFTSETIDGVALSHTFAPLSDWRLQTEVYAGEYEYFEVNPFVQNGQALLAKAKDVVGFQLWLSTPVSGLRLGLGGHTREVSDGLVGIFRQPGEEQSFDDYYVSLDLVRDRFVFRTEYREFDTAGSSIFNEAEFSLGYVQLGIHATEKIRFYGQYEFSDAFQSKESCITFGLPCTEDVNLELRRDPGIALNYLFSPNSVLKLEYHFDIEAELNSFVPVFTTEGPKLQPVIARSTDANYTILSLAVSF